MLLKDLKEHYNVSDFEKGKYLLYCKDENSYGKYLARQFYCVVEKVGTTKFQIVPSKHFEGVLAMNTLLPTNDINMLCACVDEYVKSLPFHSDIYQPSFRENCFYSYALAEYLNTIGLVRSRDNYTHGDLFELENKDVYGKSNKIMLGVFGIEMMDDKSTDVIIKMYTTDNAWMSFKVEKDINKMIDFTNKLLAPLFIGNSIKQFDNFKKLNKVVGEFPNIEKTVVDVNTYQVNSENYKDKLIEELENMLTLLKSE